MISVKQVTKRFRLYAKPSDRILEWMLPQKRHEDFFALRDVSLEIPRGRTVGIVGPNGAGKSTLLKLITGVLLPTTGSIELNGRVAALLELGTGFHGEFTGRQNIYVNGQLLGFSHGEMAELEEEIIGFSELGDFIDQPIRTYSSGMIMRLGFSIAASLRPQILIVDEALSVGDARFSQKCIRRIREFRDAGATILFVSHDAAAIVTLCDEAVLLEKGRVRLIASPRDVMDEYNALIAGQGLGNVEMTMIRTSGESSVKRHGTFHALISKLEVLDERGAPAEFFMPDDTMILRARIDFLIDAPNPAVGFLIKDRLGLDLFGTNTVLQKLSLDGMKAGEFAEVEFRVPLRLGYGEYSVTVAVHEDETHLEACYEWADNAAIFRVRMREKPDWTGMVRMEPTLTVTRGRGDVEDRQVSLEERFAGVSDPLSMGLQTPSPFLGGFSSPESDMRGGFRVVANRCRFVFRPSGKFLRIHLFVADEPVPMSLRLTSGVGGDLIVGACEIAQGALQAQIPRASVGRLDVYELEWSSTIKDKALRPAIYTISSNDSGWDADTSWPVTNLGK
ncbi:hypothetical protein BH09SUM1_BH09SUM1_04200 [soil metagenome]